MSEYRLEHSFEETVKKMTEEVQRKVEQEILDANAHVLEEFGYVKVVRCRDCEWFTPEYFYEEERGFGSVEILSDPPDCGNPERCSHHYDSLTKKTVPVHIVTDPDGFCAWGKRKEVGE